MSLQSYNENNLKLDMTLKNNERMSQSDNSQSFILIDLCRCNRLVPTLSPMSFSQSKNLRNSQPKVPND